VLEIGTGWGALAIHLAATRGCRVTAITISAEQLQLARERAAAAGVAELVDVRLCDYRRVEGRFDRIVSVEMLEAVGEEFWPEYFAVCDRLLAPGGRAVIQTITMPHGRFLATRRSYGWIHKYVFPGGLIPSLPAIEEALRSRSSLRVRHREEIGGHYAATLREWRRRFGERRDEVAALGFGQRFQRMWEFYLAYCEAGFASGRLGDSQLVLERG
jgi:cyclopropane-fatty-acyl-phospholipid synthase